MFGTSGKRHVWRREGERYHQSCVMPSFKPPDTIHACCCFSAKGVGSLPKNTAMNKEWNQNILRVKHLPKIQQQFGDQQFLFQHGRAPCHKAKSVTPQTLTHIDNLWSIIKRQVNKQKLTNFDKIQTLIMKQSAAISQDVAGVDWQHPRVNFRCLEKGRSTLQILTLCIILYENLCQLLNAFNYTLVYHYNIWRKELKTLKQQTFWKPLSQHLAMATQKVSFDLGQL